MNLPKNKIPKSLTQGLYTPELIPRNVDVNDFIQVVDVSQEQQRVQQKLANQIAAPAGLGAPETSSVNGVPIPLTEAEAEEADRQMIRVLQRLEATKQKIEFVRARIDDEIAAEMGGKELSFTMDISRKPRIRRAIKKLFGVKTDTITYSMYKAMLRAKVELEKEEVADYAKGKTKPDKDSTKNKDKKDKDQEKGGGKRGFLKTSANQEEGDEQSDLEEQYEKLHPKIGRDFLAIDDAKELIRNIMGVVDPGGLNPIDLDDSNARAKAQQYKDVVESGKNNKKFRKQDLVKIDASEEEEEEE